MTELTDGKRRMIELLGSDEEIAALPPVPVTPFPNDWLLGDMHHLIPHLQRLVLDGFRFMTDVISGDLEVYGPAVELYGEGKGLFHPLIKIIPAGKPDTTMFYLLWLWQERKNPEKYLAERHKKPAQREAHEQHEWYWRAHSLSGFEY